MDAQDVNKINRKRNEDGDLDGSNVYICKIGSVSLKALSNPFDYPSLRKILASFVSNSNFLSLVDIQVAHKRYSGFIPIATLPRKNDVCTNAKDEGGGKYICSLGKAHMPLTCKLFPVGVFYQNANDSFDETNNQVDFNTFIYSTDLSCEGIYSPNSTPHSVASYLESLDKDLKQQYVEGYRWSLFTTSVSTFQLDQRLGQAVEWISFTDSSFDASMLSPDEAASLVHKKLEKLWYGRRDVVDLAAIYDETIEVVVQLSTLIETLEGIQTESDPLLTVYKSTLKKVLKVLK
jgi:hypothetical protein